MYAKSQTLPETIKVQSDNGSLRLQFSTKYNPIFGGKRKHQGLGLKDTPENWQRAIAIAWRIEGDLQHPDWQQLFDPSFAKYGLKSKYGAELKLAAPIPEPEPEMTVGAMWEDYLEWKKTVVEETTFESAFRTFTNAINGKVWNKSTRNYTQSEINLSKLSCRCNLEIVSVLSSVTIRQKSYLLSELNQAFEFCKAKGMLSNSLANPFVLDKFSAPAVTTQQKYAPKIVNGEEKEWHEVLDEDELERDRRAFTKEERDTIIKAFHESDKASDKIYAPLIEFYFLTGCRTSEALPLTWKDVDFERNLIRFSKSLGATTGKVKETKTGEVRFFYFSNNSRLKEVLLKLKGESSSNLVFPSKRGKYHSQSSLTKRWSGYVLNKVLSDGTEVEYVYPGVVTQLVDEGKISGYLSQYHTRHTYITLTAEANKQDNNALLYIASACGNSVDVILRHYLGVSEEAKIVEV
ncbi:tyrosine-type recombinase/integrase [Microcoleus sp. BROC3]|uniref:tyrosine-type recombinase/integrase n=1 Tax=Microcoleus sp. BROC3 TaxID=3055323 RepID=UPI002FCF6FEC